MQAMQVMFSSYVWNCHSVFNTLAVCRGRLKHHLRHLHFDHPLDAAGPIFAGSIDFACVGYPSGSASQ